MAPECLETFTGSTCCTLNHRAVLPSCPAHAAANGSGNKWRAGHAAGIHTVVSLLEAHEVHELDLRDVPGLCARHAIDHIKFPIADRGVPSSRTAALALARDLAIQVGAGRSVAVHCRAGIGRSSLMAAAILVHLTRDPSVAFASIAKARGVAVPDTDAQRDWVSNKTDS